MQTRNGRKLCFLPSIPPSTEAILGTINVNLFRTLAITIRAKFHASATSNANIKLYFSPDDKNYDTIPYTEELLTLTAGQYAQRTIITDNPPSGSVHIKLQNSDTTYSLTEIECWVSYDRYGDEYEEFDKKSYQMELNENKKEVVG